VFGYYFEITNANKVPIPEYYMRKQTLVNAERYITPELKEFETKALSAKEKTEELELKIYQARPGKPRQTIQRRKSLCGPLHSSNFRAERRLDSL